MVGSSGEDDGGYAFDYLTSMEDYIKNIMAIGNEGMLTKKIGEVPIMTLFIKTIIKILQISKNEIGDVDSYV